MFKIMPAVEHIDPNVTIPTHFDNALPPETIDRSDGHQLGGDVLRSLVILAAIRVVMSITLCADPTE